MKLGIYIGRFQPLHSGHMAVIQQALAACDHLLVLVGSAFGPRTAANPWSYDERWNLIGDCLDEADIGATRTTIEGVPDEPSDEAWVSAVRGKAAEWMRDNGYDAEEVEVFLVGHRKDASSYYLDLFPGWRTLAVENYAGLDATALRTEIFGLGSRGSRRWDGVEPPSDPEGTMPPAARRFVHDWVRDRADAWDAVQAEGVSDLAYWACFANAPFPPTFVTTDAVVVRSGHVLQVQRNGFPGRGLWALPGGFLKPDLRLVDSAIAELVEETGIAIPIEELRLSLRGVRVFDRPNRSSRGRAITHAHLFALPPGPLPQVSADDDAGEVRWIPVSQMRREEMFEDHYAITTAMFNQL